MKLYCERIMAEKVVGMPTHLSFLSVLKIFLYILNYIKYHER
jgi:hypothetical protein